MWHRKPLPWWTPAEEEAFRAQMAAERVRDWLDEQSDRYSELRCFAPVGSESSSGGSAK
jgi:hypothetical protein